MVTCLHPYETRSPVNLRSESTDRPSALAVRASIGSLGASTRSGEFAAVESRPRPTLSPTVAPLGHERLIGVRSIHNRDVMVVGGATGRHYHFAAGQSREIPLSDARLLVAEGDFGFSGGR